MSKITDIKRSQQNHRKPTSSSKLPNIFFQFQNFLRLFSLIFVRINGIPACVNKELLVDLVRNEWGFRGYISTDDDATLFEITQHHYYKTPEEVVAASVKVIATFSV